MGDMLLPHLMGAYRLTVDNVETYLLVMMNIMWSNLTLHRKFDLKGSLINRAVKEKEKVSLKCFIIKAKKPKKTRHPT